MATGTLTGTTIASTYKSILKVKGGANTVLHATTHQLVEDGDGNDSVLSLAIDSVGITGSGSRLYFSDKDGEYISGDGTDLTITSGNDIVLAVGAAGSVHSAGVAGTSNTVLGVDAGIGLEAGSNYNVLIGDLVGDASMDDATYNVGVGYGALGALEEGDANTCIGATAGTLLTDGADNVMIGSGAGDSSTLVSNTVLIGVSAGTAALTTATNGTVAIGRSALSALTSGEHNLSIGYDSMSANQTSDDNVGIGWKALKDLTNDGTTRNVAVGNYSQQNIVSGIYNTTLGYNTLGSATTALNNTAIGMQAMSDVVDGVAVDGCVAVGWGALQGNASNTTGINGTIAIGHSALTALTSGSGNVAVGYKAGAAQTTGGDDTIVGFEAGENLNGGSNCTAIGRSALNASVDGDNNTALGYKTLLYYEGADGEGMNTAVGSATGLFVSTGQFNTLMGFRAGQGVTDARLTGDNNTAIGKDAGLLLQGAAQQNTLVGSTAGQAMTTGSYNTAIGLGAAGAVVANGFNTAVGRSAVAEGDCGANTGVGYEALKVSTGGNNTAVGMQAGVLIAAGANNTCIGANAGASITIGHTNVCLGYNAEPAAADTNESITLGNSSISSLRCQVDISVLSDERDKEDIEDLSVGLDFINTLRPVKFTWNMRDGGKVGIKEAGFIAQDLDASQQAFDAEEYLQLVLKENPEKLEATPARLLPILVKAVQELSAEVKELKEKRNA